MGWKIPKFLQDRLSSVKYRFPFENFINNSTYYANLNWQWMSYMQSVVRPCIAYATAAVDGVCNSSLSTATGMAIAKGATKLIAGDKSFFFGNDETCKFFSDIWAPATNFNRIKTRAISFLVGGTTVLKANKTANGKNTLSAHRIDRTMCTWNEDGEVVHAIFYLGLLSTLKSDNSVSYWLVEERGYENGGKYVCYKVFINSGTVESPTLPSPDMQGIPFDDLPIRAKEELKTYGIEFLNSKLPLNTIDGLGVWLMQRSATNSCVPDSPLGDPILYGCLDILWSIDLVFTGSVMDVLNGEGKILVPKQFLQETLNRLQTKYPGADFNITTAEVNTFGDDSFVYVLASGLDREKQTPIPVQFEIRAEQYGKMLEMYERLACVRAGFSPTSIFPYLTPDNSAKTAREVTAEENLTRATVREIQNIIEPVFDRALREIASQENFKPNIHLQLGDYIGNKLEYDENIRQNYAAKLIPHEEAVQAVNSLSYSETQEYIAKIDEDIQHEKSSEALFNERDYYISGNDDTEEGK